MIAVAPSRIPSSSSREERQPTRSLPGRCCTRRVGRDRCRSGCRSPGACSACRAAERGRSCRRRAWHRARARALRVPLSRSARCRRPRARPGCRGSRLRTPGSPDPWRGWVPRGSSPAPRGRARSCSNREGSRRGRVRRTDRSWRRGSPSGRGRGRTTNRGRSRRRPSVAGRRAAPCGARSTRRRGRPTVPSRRLVACAVA